MALSVLGCSCITKQRCFEPNGWRALSQQQPLGMPPSCTETAQGRLDHGAAWNDPTWPLLQMWPWWVSDLNCCPASSTSWEWWIPEITGSPLPLSILCHRHWAWPCKLCIACCVSMVSVQAGAHGGTRLSISSPAPVNYKGNITG